MWQKHLLHWNEASDWLRKTRIGWGHLQREPLWRHHMVSVTWPWPESLKNSQSQEKQTQTGGLSAVTFLCTTRTKYPSCATWKQVWTIPFNKIIQFLFFLVHHDFSFLEMYSFAYFGEVIVGNFLHKGVKNAHFCLSLGLYVKYKVILLIGTVDFTSRCDFYLTTNSQDCTWNDLNWPWPSSLWSNA